MWGSKAYFEPVWQKERAQKIACMAAMNDNDSQLDGFHF
jgi:hypothetical protein